MLKRKEWRRDAVPPWQGSVPLTNEVILSVVGGNEGVGKSDLLAIPAAYRALALLSGTFAGMDKYVVSRNTGKQKATSIVNSPNGLIDEYLFWEHAFMQTACVGDFIALKEGSPRATSLHPLDPNIIDVKWVVKNNRIIDKLYVVHPPDGEAYGIPVEQIFHVPGMGFDGLRGVSIVEAASRTIINAKRTEEFAGKLWENGALMSGVLTTDKRIDEASAKALKKRWRDRVQGLSNAFDIAVLDSGTQFTPISLAPQDAQFLEARNFNVNEIARIFGVSPVLLMAEAGGPQAADPEQMTIIFLLFTMRLWTQRFKSAIDTQLLGSSEEVIFNPNELIKPDTRTRSSAAVMWRKAKIKSINEIRADEGLPPLDDPDADDPLADAGSGGDGGQDPGTNDGNEEPLGDVTEEPSEDVDLIDGED